MSSDRPVDLEKGATEVKAVATKVNPCMTMCAKVFVDVVAVLHVLFSIGAGTWIVSRSDNWWHPLPAVAILLALLVFTLWLKPKTDYAMEPTPGSDKDDLSNKLLAEK